LERKEGKNDPIVSLYEKPNSGKKEKGWQPPFVEVQSHLTLKE